MGNKHRVREPKHGDRGEKYGDVKGDDDKGDDDNGDDDKGEDSDIGGDVSDDHIGTVLIKMKDRRRTLNREKKSFYALFDIHFVGKQRKTC